MDVICLNCKGESKDVDVLEVIEKNKTIYRCPLCNDAKIVSKFMGIPVNDREHYKVDNTKL